MLLATQFAQGSLRSHLSLEISVLDLMHRRRLYATHFRVLHDAQDTIPRVLSMASGIHGLRGRETKV